MLAFKKIEYEYFRNTEYYSFEFPDNGLIVISGLNGCGKSTFIMAIYDALFGIEKSHCMLDHETSTKVTLHFVHNDIEYKVSRAKGRAVLYKDGDKFLTSVREVNRYIKGLIDPLVAEATIFLTNDFVGLPDIAKKQIIDNLITIDFDPYKKKADLYSRHIKSSIVNDSNMLANIDEQIIVHKQELVKEISNYRISIKKKEEDIKYYNDTILNLRQKAIEFENILSSLDIKKDEEAIANKREEIEELNNKLVSYTNKQSELKLECEKLKLKLKEINTDIKNRFSQQLENELHRTESAKMQLRFKMDGIEENGKSLKNEMASALSKLEYERDKIISQYNQSISTAKLRLEQLSGTCPLCKSKADIDLSKPIVTTCPICGTKASSEHNAKQAAQYKNDIEELENKIKEVNEQYIKDKESTERSYNDQLKALRQQWDELKNNIAQYDKIIDELKARSDQIEQEMQETYEKESAYVIEQYQAKSKQLHDYNNFLSRETLRIQKLKMELENMNNEYNDMKSQYDETKRKYELAMSKINELTAKLDAIKETDISDNMWKYVRTTLVKDIKERRNIRQRIFENTKKLEHVKFWQKGFGIKGIKALVMSEIVPAINKTLYKYGIELNMVPVLIVDDKGRFQIVIKSDKTFATLADDLSKGETRIVNVLFNIALSSIFPCNCVFNDEAFDGLDRVNASIVMSLLSKASTDKITFIITHSPIWKSFDCDLVLTPGKCGGEAA